ncbi:hypothetical protein ACMV8I_19650 [Ewingella sp. S1.OA.A_B6]
MEALIKNPTALRLKPLIASFAADSVRSTEDKLHIGVMLWHDFPLLALSGLMGALRYAAGAENKNKKKHFLLSIISAQPGNPIISSVGISVTPDTPHHSPDLFDYIAVVGGNLTSFGGVDTADRRYILRAHQVGVPIIGIGTGSFILAKEGLNEMHRKLLYAAKKC